MLNLRRKSIEWAIRSIIKDFDTYLFPMPFEYDAIKAHEDRVLDYLCSIDVLKNGLREYRTTLTPKSTTGFRVATQMDPLDSIISLAVIYDLSSEIETYRIGSTENKVFSFRIAPQTDGTLYDPAYSWTAFKEHIKRKMDSGDFTYIVSTDISDFYPSIYLHDIETVLGEVTDESGRTSHSTVLLNYVRAMNLNQTHKGLPVGPQFSRPIAELILNDIDRALISRDIEFARYVDDFVIFTKSKGEAYEALSFLAQTLYDRRGLKLNDQKTSIDTIYEYTQKFLRVDDEIIEDSILDSFTELLDELDLDKNPYKEIEPDDLSDEDWERLRSINLGHLLELELRKEEPDAFLVSFVLANLARLDDTDIVDIILSEESILKLFPRLRTIINYLQRVREFSDDQKHIIGAKILDFVINSYVSVLKFNRMWFMHLFTTNNEWNNSAKFTQIYDLYSDHETRRETILARGRAKDIDFFRQQKYESLDTNSWLRRAFLAAVSCLPKTERNPYYKSRSLTHRDFLDEIIELWAQTNHF
jgi:hypothetical protein